MAEAHMERKERVKALGYRLSPEILEHILSFEPYPIHPVAVLIKPLRISYGWTNWMPEPNLTMEVHGRAPSGWTFRYIDYERRQVSSSSRQYRSFFISDMFDSEFDYPF